MVKLANNKLSVSQNTLSIILGSILGDGCLKKYAGYKNARLSIRQSMKQVEYFMYKVKALAEISTEKSVQIVKPDKLRFGQTNSYLYQSASLPDLTHIYEYCYGKSNRLKIQRRWLNKITPLALCIWWLDDGSIISNGRKGVICTDGFDLEGVKKLARFLQVNYNINVTIGNVNKVYKNTSKTYHRLYLNTSELKKLLTLILPYFPVKEMLYKGMIRYDSAELQQRWISEMNNLLPPFSKKNTENDIVPLFYKT